MANVDLERLIGRLVIEHEMTKASALEERRAFLSQIKVLEDVISSQRKSFQEKPKMAQVDGFYGTDLELNTNVTRLSSRGPNASRVANLEAALRDACEGAGIPYANGNIYIVAADSEIEGGSYCIEPASPISGYANEPSPV